MRKLTPITPISLLFLFLALLLAACGGDGTPSASQTALQQDPSPQGRILTANQAANTITIIDVATDQPIAAVGTGAQPHHVLGTPDGKEFWVTLYGENRLQVFDSTTLKEIASVDVGESNDDLAFSPDGKRLYVSLGKSNSIAVIDVEARKLLNTVPVGKTPHGVRVTPDGAYLLVTNTADNTLSVLSLQPEAAVDATIKTGANPFEVVTSADSKTAYVSNFLGDSIGIIDLATRKTTGYIRSGKQPAMIALDGSAGAGMLWVANTGSGEVWLVDAATKALVTRLPAGRGAHGTAVTPSGKLYVTNTNDSTVTIIDTNARSVLSTVPVGNGPNGLTFLPSR
jgi:YVTN family beta-propeller protein